MLTTDHIDQLITRLQSPHADKVYVAKDYTKADLIRDLERLKETVDAELDSALRCIGYG